MLVDSACGRGLHVVRSRNTLVISDLWPYMGAAKLRTPVRHYGINVRGWGFVRILTLPRKPEGGHVRIFAVSAETKTK